MDKLFQRTGAFLNPFIITLLFVCGTAAQSVSETRSIGYELQLESAEHLGALEAPAHDVPVPALSVRIGVHSKRVTPTSQKGELPVNGKLEFIEPPRDIETVKPSSEKFSSANTSETAE